MSFDAVGLPGFHYIVCGRLHPFDLEQAAVVEAIFLYNTAQRDQMMPRKPFPHPELDKQRSTPLPNLYPNAVVPDAGKPSVP